MPDRTSCSAEALEDKSRQPAATDRGAPANLANQAAKIRTDRPDARAGGKEAAPTAQARAGISIRVWSAGATRQERATSPFSRRSPMDEVSRAVRSISYGLPA